MRRPYSLDAAVDRAFRVEVGEVHEYGVELPAILIDRLVATHDIGTDIYPMLRARPRPLASASRVRLSVVGAQPAAQGEVRDRLFWQTAADATMAPVSPWLVAFTATRPSRIRTDLREILA